MEENNHYFLTPTRELYKKNFSTKEIQTDHSFTVCRKLYLDDSISTPPSELRSEIFSLRNELLEAHEFHDLELKVLKEENVIEDMEFKMNKNIKSFEKYLEDAEKHIDDANKEIIQLKLINQDLNKKLKDESSQNVILKQQYEDEVAKLLQSLKKKKCEIQILEKDKSDSAFKMENFCKIYDGKINELQLALDSANEKLTKIENERDNICKTLEQRILEEKERVNELSKELEDKNFELNLCKQEILTLKKENEVKQENSCHKNKYFSSIKNVTVQTDLTENKNQEKILSCEEDIQTLEKDENVSKELQDRNENFNGNNLLTSKELNISSEIIKEQGEKIECLKNVKKLKNTDGDSSQNLINITVQELVSDIVNEKSFETSNQEKYLNNILSSDKTKNIEKSVPEIEKNVVKNDNNEYDDTKLTVKINTNNEMLKIDTYSNDIVSSNSSEIFSQNSVAKNSAFSLHTRHNDEDTFNFTYELYTLDEKKMQLNIKSESKMTEFINEFAQILLKNNIIDLNELKTCSNIFYSLLNKYLVLMELYSHLKTNFDSYRLSEQKECYNVMVHYLDNLCSQLEESLNLSDSSLVFFKDCPASSTMMDVSEVEISVINDITLKINDPLALTNEISYQTPLKNIIKSNAKNPSFDFKTPLKSVSKYLRTPLKTASNSNKKQISGKSNGDKIYGDLTEIQPVQSLGSLTENKENTCESNIDNDKKLRDAEAIIETTLKNFALLEERFMKLESIFTTFQIEKEKLIKDNERLQELLLEKSKEVEDVKEKLIIEVISLNSELQDTLSDVSCTNILSLFINTVKESCNKIPEILSQKLITEIELLNVKVNAYETKILESDRTIEKLMDLNEELKTEKEVLEKDISDRSEEIRKLNLEVLDIHTLKLKIEYLEKGLREREAMLKTETFLRENILKDLEKLKTIFEKVEGENMTLNKKKNEFEKTITNLNVELKLAKEQLLNYENKEEELTKEIESLRSALAEAEDRNNNLQETIQSHKSDIISAKNSHDLKSFEIKLLNEKLMETENHVHQKEHIISEMSCALLELQKNFDFKSQELCDLNNKIKIQNNDFIESDNKCKCLEEEIKGMSEKIEKYEAVNKFLSEKLEKLILRIDETKVLLILQEEIIKKKQIEIESAVQERFICAERILNLKEIIGTLKNEKQELELFLVKKHIASENLFSNEMKALNLDLLKIIKNLNMKNKSVDEVFDLLEEAEDIKLQGDIISPLKLEIELLKQNILRLTSIESILHTYEEREDLMTKDLDILKSKQFVLESDLSSKTIIIAELNAELEEAREVNNEKEKTLSVFQKEIEELKKKNYLLEETLIKAEKDLERLKSNEIEVENLKLKLTSAEDSLNAKVEIMVSMSAKLEQAEENKISYEKAISVLKIEIEELKNNVNNVENLLEIAQNKGNENEIRIANLNKKIEDSSLTESSLNSKIEFLEKKLLEAEENVKFQEKKIIELLEVQDELVNSKKLLVLELNANTSTQKELNKELIKANQNLEFLKNEIQEYAFINDDLNQKIIICKEINEANKVEILSLKEKLVKSENGLDCYKLKYEKIMSESKAIEANLMSKEDIITKLNSGLEHLKALHLNNSTALKTLEVEKSNLLRSLGDCEKQKTNLFNVFLDIQTKLDFPKDVKFDLTAGITEWQKVFSEKINDIHNVRNQEVQNLKLELAKSKEVIENLQKETDKSYEKNLNNNENSVNSKKHLQKTDLTDDNSSFIKNTFCSKRHKLNDHASFISHRLEKLENLNDLLSGTLHKIIDALNIPFHDNLFSVGFYETSEAQIMKYISNLTFIKNNSSMGESENGSKPGEVQLTYEKFEELDGTIFELRKSLSKVTKYLGLPEGVISSQEIINQIDKIIEDTKKDFIIRIDILRQDNQHLDDDNYLLQQELKKLKEQYDTTAQKLADFQKMGEFYKTDTNVLNVKATKIQARDKTVRKLEKLEELNESLAEIVMKILSLTSFENLKQINLITNSGFLSQRNQILNHFENWVHSKTREIQELKEHNEQLDEECESYAKEIIEAKKETVKIWEEGQTNINNLKSQIGQMQKEYKFLKSEKEKLIEKINYFKSDTSKMAINEEVAYDEVEMHQQKNEYKVIDKLEDSAVSAPAGINQLEKLNEENTALQLQIMDLEKEIAQSKKEMEKLDEECECYAKVIKKAEKETAKVWEEGRAEINNLKLQIKLLQEENNNLKLEKENGFKGPYNKYEPKMKSYNGIENSEAEFVSCHCKKGVKELKSAIFLKEMKILDSEQLTEKNVANQSQILYLENSLANSKKQFAEEKDKNKKLREELNEFCNGQKKNILSENNMLEKLRNKNFFESNTVQQIEDRERIQKLEKDNKMLKELCRTRYNEIKKLEKENLFLKGHERITK